MPIRLKRSRDGRTHDFYNPNFIETSAWERLKRFLEDPSDRTIGLSGPRGAGKTETMRKACDWAEKRGGFGVWFPSPSEYEPLDFLAALSDVTADQFLQKHGPRNLEKKADELRRQARYTATFTEASEVGADVAQGGLGAALKRKHQQQLVERPATLSSSIHRFRSFARLVPAIMGAPMVLAIDELDKLDDPETAVQLLRSIKALFDIDGVNVIVSISDEAAKHLELGAVSGRNEFNSSFGKVIRVSELPTTDGLELSHQKIDGNEQVSDEARYALTALSGGVPRELARMSEIVYSQLPYAKSGGGAAVTVVLHEADSFIRELLHDGSSGGDSGTRVSEGEKLAVYKILGGRRVVNADRLKGIANSALVHWTPSWASHTWMSVFGEQWRGLLVRALVGSLFFRQADETTLVEETEELKEVIATVYLSPHVGLEMLFYYLLSQLVNDGPTQVDRWSSLLIELFTTPKAEATIADVEESVEVGREDIEKLRSVGVLEAANGEDGAHKLVQPQLLVQALQPALRR